MIIRHLTIENFGVFRGKHVFNFQPIQENGTTRPIILIGGMNGAGKTTIFDGIRTCLYGKNIDEFRLKKGAYEKYIKSQIHQILGSPLQLDTAFLEIEFEYAHLGKSDIYSVKRAWLRSDGHLDETLTIKKNDQELSELESSQWQEFINELIPPGISQLFFFDGEKIQSLAEEENDTIHLKDSFKSLLGLHIVDQLKHDLNIFLARKAKIAGHDTLTNEFLLLRDKKAELEETIEQVMQNLAQKHAQLDQLKAEIDRQETHIAGEGGTFAGMRNELKLKRSELEHQIESEKNRIREFCAQLFPFSLTPKYCTLVRERLHQEDAYQKYLSTQHILDSIRKKVNQHIQSEDFWGELEVSPRERKKIAKKIEDIVEELPETSPQFQQFTPVHQLSPIDHQKMLVWIDRALHEVPHQMEDASIRLEYATRERHQIQATLEKAPDDDVLSPLIHHLNELNKDFGQLSEQIKKEQETLRQYQYQLTEVDRKIGATELKLQSIDFDSRKLHFAREVTTILQEYSIELQHVKIQELADIFLDCFNRLLRKGKFITKTEINIDDFTIVLYDRGGNIRPKSKLSVGEKQIYAIAMLWALTIASGRPLPFVIDTPLGRLDSNHRKKLVKDFFPSASHQMIILSTDTEIDQKYFNQLTPFIARSYHLEYNQDEGTTSVTEGYFWEHLLKEVTS